MITKTLYIIQQPNGVITHTPEQPEEGVKYMTAYRLIADEGMILVNGEQKTYCIDTDTLDGWEEMVDDTPQEPLMEVDKHERDENDQF